MNKSGYFTDSEGNHLLGATLGENVFLTDGTDLETKLNNMSNVVDVTSHFSLQSGFSIQSWGFYKALRIGKIILFTYSGLTSSTNLTSDTLTFITDLTFRTSVAGICKNSNNIGIATAMNGNIYFNAISGGSSCFGQLIIPLE